MDIEYSELQKNLTKHIENPQNSLWYNIELNKLGNVEHIYTIAHNNIELLKFKQISKPKGRFLYEMHYDGRVDNSYLDDEFANFCIVMLGVCQRRHQHDQQQAYAKFRQSR